MDDVDLLARAAGGCPQSWDIIVRRYSSLVWTVARSSRLSHADAADVSQTTWLRLMEHLGDIRDGRRLGAWLTTTARREAVATLRRSARLLPAGQAWQLERADPLAEAPESPLLRQERDRTVRAAMAQLPLRCQRLLVVLMADPPPTYAQVGSALGMPLGSIGPTRCRCLQALRHYLGSGGQPG